MKFEWDDNKNCINFAKHKINFELACTVFNDPLARYFPDRITNGEERWRVIGHAPNSCLLVVIHCYRSRNNEEIIRIISARPADSHERKRYEEE